MSKKPSKKRPSEMSSRDYHSEIKLLADMAIERVRESKEMDKFGAADRLVRDHQWIIYSGYTTQILLFSQNENEIMEVDGELPQSSDTVMDAITEIAFYAMRRDVIERIDEIIRDSSELEGAEQ